MRDQSGIIQEIGIKMNLLTICHDLEIPDFEDMNKIYRCCDCGSVLRLGLNRCETCFTEWLYRTRSYEVNKVFCKVLA